MLTAAELSMLGLMHSNAGGGTSRPAASGWVESYTPPAPWEWPSSSAYQSGGQQQQGGGTQQGAAGAAVRRRPLSAARASPTSSTAFLSPVVLPVAAVARTSTAPTGAARTAFRGATVAFASASGPWGEGGHHGGGGREGQGGGPPLSPHSQRLAALSGSRSASASPVPLGGPLRALECGRSPPPVPSPVTGISYFSRQRGPARDDTSEDGNAGVPPRSASAAPNSPARGGFAGATTRLPKRAVPHPTSQSPAPLSTDPWMTRVTGAIANGVATAAATSGLLAGRSAPSGPGAASPIAGGKLGKAVGSPHRPAAMPFVVLDGETARGQTPMSSPMLSISGRKVAK